MESKAEIVQRINAMAVQFGVVSKEDYERTDEEGNFTSRPKHLSVLYLMLKLHKKDKVGSRAVAGGSFVPTTGISQVLSRALRLCIPVCDSMTQELFLVYTGFEMAFSSILHTTDGLLDHVKVLNGWSSRGVIDLEGAELSSLDFTALYPSVMHADLLKVLLAVLVSELSWG